MSYKREVFNIQGVTFKLRPTSPKNVRAITEVQEEDFDFSDEEDQFVANAKMHLKLLDLFAEAVDGDPSDIDPEDLDIAKVNHYFSLFRKPLTMM